MAAFGLMFPNPLGIAAGFDKDARVPDGVLGLGCGFAEIGTVTPEPRGYSPASSARSVISWACSGSRPNSSGRARP